MRCWRELSEVVLMIDLDNTLVVSPISSLINKAYEELAMLSGRTKEFVVTQAMKIHLNLIKMSTPRAFDWDYIADEVSKVLGVRYKADIEGRFSKNFCKEVKILDNAYEVLQKLRDLGYKLVLSTNGLMKYQECVIRESSLNRYFDLIVSPDRVGCLKNCRNFYSCCDSSGELITVGDSYVFDVYFPKTFGFKAIHVLRWRSIYEDTYRRLLSIDASVVADDVVENLQQLPSALFKLRSSFNK